MDTAIKHIEQKHVNISVLVWTVNVELKAITYENSSLGMDKIGLHDYCNIPVIPTMFLAQLSKEIYTKEFHFGETIKCSA